MNTFPTALLQAGFLSAIVKDLWVNLEYATDEIQVTAPKPYPLQPIDRSVQKVMINSWCSFQ